MGAPHHAAGPPRWRPRTGHLWLLAAILAGATLINLASAIHDTGQRRAAAMRVTRTAAEQISIHASGRLLQLALETFAPVTPWSAREPPPARVALEALLQGQRDGERCRCRELLPVSAFFQMDVAADSLVAEPVTRDAGTGIAPPLTALADLARADARTDGPRLSSIHLAADRRLGTQTAVTVVQHDERGRMGTVYGLLADTRETVRAIFGHPLVEHGPPDSSGGRFVGLVVLDSLSLEVTSDAGTTLFGRIGPGHRHLAHVRPRGPLEGLTITVGLAPSQIPGPLVALIPRGQLWYFSLFLVATILVTVAAASASRREAVLASARSDFIAGVSHDLRMPLAQILIAGETLALRRDRDERERLGLVNAVVREARRLVALVENVLLFSRSGATTLKPAMEPLPVRELLDEAAEAARLAVEDAGQTIEVRADPSLGALGDRRLVRQALVNLIDNAMKYGSPGQRILLEGWRSSDGRVRLGVEDRGSGVPRGERHRVFEAYERLARDQRSERTGTGLGLAIVRQVAAACRGEAWLEDAPDGGTRAVIELPSAAEPQPAVETVGRA